MKIFTAGPLGTGGENDGGKNSLCSSERQRNTCPCSRKEIMASLPWSLVNDVHEHEHDLDMSLWSHTENHRLT